MTRPETTPEMIAEAHRQLRRIHELEQAGLLNCVLGFGQLSPVERLAVAQGTYKH